MSAWSEHVLEFWEGVHKRGSNVHIGNTQAADYATYFSKAGPFAKDLAAAQSVLDIGPGFGRYLAAAQGKSKRAIDVSRLARERVRGMGVVAHAPGEIPAGVSDLATCLSVIQHCAEEAVGVIMSDSARALRSGGRFYLNGVHGGHHTPSPEGRLHGARFSYSLDYMKELAGQNGFSVIGEHSYRVGALGVWILCLGRS